MSGAEAGAVEAVIEGRARSIGDLAVRRVLPARRRRRTVGPFIFLDHMGPVRLGPGGGVDVAPHPHIGLATLTFLFEGELVHRDGLGTVRTIRPGDVNWMSAGRGLAHSERSPGAARPGGAPLHGLQCWVALPRALEESDPTFTHHPACALPRVDGDGAVLRVVAGTWDGARSPLETPSATSLVDATLERDAALEVVDAGVERGVYVVSGAVDIEGVRLTTGALAVLRPHATPALTALDDTRLAVIGGDPVDGERHIWWNFVSSRAERIEQARADWSAGRFAPVPGESERIEAPER